MIPASAPGKAILFGEHAVVYGQPAIALPIRSLRCEVIIEKSRDSQTRIHSEDTGETLAVDETSTHPLAYTWQLAGEALPVELPAAEIRIRSAIPIAAGFGSGAALTTALLRACQQWAGRELADESLNELVYRVEQRYHGNPSGIDNHVVIFERPLYFQQDEPPEFLTLGAALPMIGLCCGKGAPTRAVVEDLRLRRVTQPEPINANIQAIGALTREAREKLLAGDLVGVGGLMYENHRRLFELGVSSPMQDELVEMARAKGALGAKMSGAGWGGQVLVLAAPAEGPRLTAELRDAGYPPLFSEMLA